MNPAFRLVAFVVALGIIIFVHEFGHLIVAKAFSMRVFVFSFGFGKRLFGFKWGETDCRVSLVPLGGYVKLEGEGDDLVSEDTSTLGDGKDFLSRPRWQRFVVYLAGPVMNAVLTLVVLTIFGLLGTLVEAWRFDRPIVGTVDPGSPAQQAGIVAGDEILAIDGALPRTWEDAEYQILVRPEKTIRLRLRHEGEEREVAVVSEATSPQRVGSIGVHHLVRVGRLIPGQPAEQAGLRVDDAILSIDGKPVRSFTDILPIVRESAGKPMTLHVMRDGAPLDVTVAARDSGSGLMIGIAPKMVLKKFGLGGAAWESLGQIREMTRQTFDLVGRLITGQLSVKTMMGPVGIAQAAGDAAEQGIAPFVYLIALLSLQVGILNLFPLAPLDGGHMAILAVEGAARRDMNPRVKMWIMNAGALVIFLLIGVVVFYADIPRLAFVHRLLQ
jgi:regulator of sigma E protease